MIHCRLESGPEGNRNKTGYMSRVWLCPFPLNLFFQRHEYIRTIKARDSETTFSRPSTPSFGSGYQTPREIREEQWRLESESNKPGKVEMREIYKELGGRKARTKTKYGAATTRDKGGWTDGDDY
jgi:hypothetical protein